MVAEAARPGHHDRPSGVTDAMAPDGFHEWVRFDPRRGDRARSERFAAGEHQSCGVIDDPGGDVGEGVRRPDGRSRARPARRWRERLHPAQQVWQRAPGKQVRQEHEFGRQLSRRIRARAAERRRRNRPFRPRGPYVRMQRPGDRPDLRDPSDPQHVPLRLPEVLGRDLQGPAPGLHRALEAAAKERFVEFSRNGAPSTRRSPSCGRTPGASSSRSWTTEAVAESPLEVGSAGRELMTPVGIRLGRLNAAGGLGGLGARWIFMRLNAVAARCNSLVTLSRPRREKRSMIFLRLPMPGSTVAPRRLYNARPSSVRSRCLFASRGVTPAGGGRSAGSSAQVRAWSRSLPRAMSRSGPAAVRFASLLYPASASTVPITWSVLPVAA